MARKFLTPIDLNKNSLLNALLHPTGVAPTSPATGQAYFDTGASKLKIWDGSAWLTVGSTQEEVEDLVANLIKAGTGVSVTYDDVANTLTIGNTGVTSITGTTNEIDVTSSTGSVTISLPATVAADISGNAATATKLATARTIELTGDVTGSATFDGSATASIAATIAANSVALGTDTTGNYVATVTGTTNEIEVTGAAGEGTAVTIGLPDNVTITNNLTVSGNLTVNGTTTSVNTETLDVADNIILLNSNVTGTPTENAGIEIERGTSANVLLRWNETSDKWELTTDGTTYSNITVASDISTVTRKYSATIGDGALTSIPVVHSLGTDDVVVSVRDVSSKATVECDVVHTSSTTVTLGFATAPALNSLRVVVVG